MKKTVSEKSTGSVLRMKIRNLDAAALAVGVSESVLVDRLAGVEWKVFAERRTNYDGSEGWGVRFVPLPAGKGGAQ